MCSVFGALGDVDVAFVERLAALCADRGRDGGRVEKYPCAAGGLAVLGNWRAAPTTEPKDAPLQPYDGVVHNGTIANDRELGNPLGAVDSMVLPKVLDRSSLVAFAASLGRVKGSFALAAYSATASDIFLAANYKPLHWTRLGGFAAFASMERHLAPFVGPGLRPAVVPPYSAMSLGTGQVVRLPRQRPPAALVVCSAGLDSTTVAAHYAAQGREVRLLHFTYGCNAESKEASRIPAIAEALGASCEVLPLDYSRLRGDSPLFTKREPADGVAGAEFAFEWVPARNLVMLSTATAYAEANGFGTIALGNNLEESGAYPDNEEQFTHLVDGALDYAVRAGFEVRIEAPLGALMKHEIVALGSKLGAPLGLTWSCYRNGDRHCGECGPCYMRREAFARCGLVDPVFQG